MTVRDDLPKLFADKQEKLLDEVSNFKYSAENDTVGEYGERGFLMQIMLILMED